MEYKCKMEVFFVVYDLLIRNKKLIGIGINRKRHQARKVIICASHGKDQRAQQLSSMNYPNVEHSYQIRKNKSIMINWKWIKGLVPYILLAYRMNIQHVYYICWLVKLSLINLPYISSLLKPRKYHHTSPTKGSVPFHHNNWYSTANNKTIHNYERDKS